MIDNKASTSDFPSTPLWLTWDLARDAWLDAHRARSAATAQAYAEDYTAFFDWAQVRPWQVSPGLAIGYARHLRELGRAPSTVNRRLSGLESFYRFVQHRYLVPGACPDGGRAGGHQQPLWPLDRINPFTAVERQLVSHYGRARYPSTQELRRVLAIIDTRSRLGKRDLALILAISSTCLRSTAILTMHWGDIEPRDDADYNLTYTSKGGLQRRAVLPAQAFACICDYLRSDNRPPETMRPHDPVFVAVYPDRAANLPNGHRSNPGTTLSNSVVNRLLKKYARHAGVDPALMHIHGLRHAGARLRIEQDRAAGRPIDLLELMHILGHRSIATTQIYADAVADQPQDPGAAAAAAALHPVKELK
jgi:site-specific recombinase XerD